LLKKLKCINCYDGSLKTDDNGLICSACGQRIPIRSDIPDFLSIYSPGELSWNKVNIHEASRYEAIIEKIEPYRFNRIDNPKLKYVSGDILEIGCGTGRFVRTFFDKEVSYFGIDPEFSFLLYAYEHHGLQRLVRGIGEKLPFHNDSFDCIIASFFSYRYVNPELGLLEARRVLKKGGIFAFDLVNSWLLKLIEIKDMIKRLNIRLLPTVSLRPSSGLFDFVKLGHLKQKVEKAGFLLEDIQATPVTPLFPALNKYLSNFYYHGSRKIYLGFDIIVILKAR